MDLTQPRIPTPSVSSAPVFTPQDEQLERATLSAQEIASAEADLRGLTSGMARLSVGTNHEGEQTRATSLDRLEKELSTLPLKLKSAYIEAAIRCPDLVDDERKIAFLERDNFDAKLAAMRLARYWDAKRDLFGPEKCFLPLTLMGAMKEEVPGLIKYCPFHVSNRDASGRAVIFINPSRLEPSQYSTKSALRALWFIIEAATEDPEVRKCGVVELFCMKNIQRKHFDPEFPRFEKALFEDLLPLHCRAIHVCHPNPVLYYVIHPIAKFFIDRKLRLRTKMHYGSDEKVVSDLGSYCLPRDCVPSEIGGNLNLDLEKWVKDRLILEGQGSHIAPRAQNNNLDGKARIEASLSKRILHIGSVHSSEPHPTIDLRNNSKVRKCRGDPRMNCAVMVKLANPSMSAYDALRAGGFDFPDKEKTRHLKASNIHDADGISLVQRRNQFCRRMRQEKIKLNGGKDHQVFIPFSKNEISSTVSNKLPNSAVQTFEVDAICSSEEAQVNSLEVQDGDANEIREIFYDTMNALSSFEESSFSANSLSEEGHSKCDDPIQHRHERRDSFYDIITELPGIKDLEKAAEFDMS